MNKKEWAHGSIVVLVGVGLAIPAEALAVMHGDTGRSAAAPHYRQIAAVADEGSRSASSEEESPPISEMPVVVTLKSSVLAPDVLIQLRDAAPKNPGSLAPLYHHRPGPMATGFNLLLYRIKPEPMRQLSSIRDLRGLVKIDSPEKALEFVRLRTNRDLVPLLSDGYPGEAEIMTAEDYLKGPRYGMNAWQGNVPSPDTPEAADHTYGDKGILSEEGFRLGGFSKPQITELPNSKGYQVIRWAYKQVPLAKSPSHRPSAQHSFLSDIVYQLIETVGRDGAYKRREMNRQDAPSLPDTEWNMMEIIL